VTGENTVVTADGTKAAVSASSKTITIDSPLTILEPAGGKIGLMEDTTTTSSYEYPVQRQTICKSDETTIATHALIAKGYTVTWKNDDGTVLQSYAVAAGETPVYEGETPTKAASAGKTYEFKEWTPAVEPATKDATYTATYTEKTDGSSSGGGILVIDPATGEPVIGGTASIIDPATGEVLDTWTPDGTAHPLPGSLPPGEYTIHVELPDGTIIEVTIIVGEDGTVSIVGPDGELTPVASDGVIVVDGSGKKYTVTWIIDGKKETEEYAYGEMPTHAKPTKASNVFYDYTFTKWTPASEKVTKDATYTAEFEASVSPFSPFSPFSPYHPGSPFGPHGTTPEPVTPAIPALPFTDVSPASPFYDDISYVYENDLMNGMSETEFGENLPLTRGMIVTVLHRMEGRPAVTYTGVFTDVPDGQWFTDGVEWAASHGIVLGYGDGRYGPDDNVTREQLAAILFRYAKYKGYDVSVGEDTNILSYDDAFTWGEWAVPALQWACGAGVIEDSPVGMLRPTEPAIRGEIAHAIHIFCEEVAK
ncbi:MAG: S-layer homology domain-containing protein, partial [Clostridia bacterium]|nr:S-layer homology domain-containing protein [Clostridia bacterium]